jgi:signal peptidase I
MTGAHLWLAIAVVVVFVAASIAIWIRWRFVSVAVEGTSMLPALRPGDKVLVRRGRSGLRPGRIVVVTRPDPMTGWKESPPAGRNLVSTRWSIKRIAALGGDPYPRQVYRQGTVPPGHVFLLGDNSPSIDSKQMGPCPTSQILGVCVRELKTRAKSS